MRILAALILITLAAWRGYQDWAATKAIGEKFEMASVDTVWSSVSPWTYERTLPMLRESEIPYLWDPSAQVFLTSPAAVVLFVLGMFFYLIRRRDFPERVVGA